MGWHWQLKHYLPSGPSDLIVWVEVTYQHLSFDFSRTRTLSKNSEYPTISVCHRQIQITARPLDLSWGIATRFSDYEQAGRTERLLWVIWRPCPTALTLLPLPLNGTQTKMPNLLLFLEPALALIPRPSQDHLVIKKTRKRFSCHISLFYNFFWFLLGHAWKVW